MSFTWTRSGCQLYILIGSIAYACKIGGVGSRVIDDFFASYIKQNIVHMGCRSQDRGAVWAKMCKQLAGRNKNHKEKLLDRKR